MLKTDHKSSLQRKKPSGLDEWGFISTYYMSRRLCKLILACNGMLLSKYSRAICKSNHSSKPKLISSTLCKYGNNFVIHYQNGISIRPFDQAIWSGLSIKAKRCQHAVFKWWKLAQWPSLTYVVVLFVAWTCEA